MKLELLYRDVAYVWREKEDMYNPQNTVHIVERDDGSLIM